MLEFNKQTQEENQLKENSNQLITTLKAMQNATGLEDLIDITMTYMASSADIGRVSFFFKEQDEVFLYADITEKMQSVLPNINLPIEEVVNFSTQAVRQCLETGKVISASTLFNPNSIDFGEITDADIESLATIPLYINGKLVGAYYLESLNTPYAFSKENQEVIQYIADQVEVQLSQSKGQKALTYWTDIAYRLGQQNITRENTNQIGEIDAVISRSEKTIRNFTDNPVLRRFFKTNANINDGLRTNSLSANDQKKYLQFYAKFGNVLQSEIGRLRSATRQIGKASYQANELYKNYRLNTNANETVSFGRAIEDIIELKYQEKLRFHKDYQSRAKLSVSADFTLSLVDNILDVVTQAAQNSGNNKIAVLTSEDKSKHYLKISTMGMTTSRQSLINKVQSLNLINEELKQIGGYMLAKGDLNTGVSFTLSIPK